MIEYHYGWPRRVVSVRNDGEGARILVQCMHAGSQRSVIGSLWVEDAGEAEALLEAIFGGVVVEG